MEVSENMENRSDYLHFSTIQQYFGFVPKKNFLIFAWKEVAIQLEKWQSPVFSKKKKKKKKEKEEDRNNLFEKTWPKCGQYEVFQVL